MNSIPDEISDLLKSLKNGILECLKSEVIAVYVYGSLTIDDFVPESSDIDFMVIVTTLPKDTTCLEKLHEWLAKTHEYGKILEGDYIPLSHISCKGGSRTKTHYGYSRTFKYDIPGDMISPDTLVAITRESITLYGPPPEDIIPKVQEKDLKQYMVDLLHEYKEEFKEVDEPPLTLASEVLNMCRSWHAALTGQVISKSEAASIGVKSLPKEWHPLIQAAVQVRHGIKSLENAAILKEQVRNFAEFLAEQFLS